MLFIGTRFKYEYLTIINIKPLRLYYTIKLKLLSYKTHIQIPARTQIGEGFYIGHSGRVIIHPDAKIGKNVNVATGVTIGFENRGARKGAPILEGNCWVGTNSVIVGNVKIGEDVLIAPLTFVNFDVPAHSIVIGNPAKIISKENATKDYAYIIPTSIDSGVIFGIIVLTALPNLFSFFVQAKYRILLEVDGRKYIITNSETTLQVLANAGKILVLLFTDSLILIQLVYCVLSLIQLSFIYIHAKRRYGWLDVKAKPDFEAISQRKSVLVHQFSGMVFNNTDILLLSFMCDFKVVSIYTIYNIFFSQVQTFITSIISGFSFALGQMFHTDKEKFMKVYNVYETIYIMSTFIIYTLMAVFLLPLIQIYTKGINDANYTNVYLVLLFVVMNLLANGKLPSNHVLEYSGKFEETRSHAIWEMVINITVSVVAILFFGICGAIIGTIVALLYRGTMMIYYSNKKVLERSMFATYKLWLVNGAVFVVIMIVFFVDSFCGLSFLDLLIKGIIHSLWIIPLYVLVNFVFFKDVFDFLITLKVKKNEHS